MGLNALNLQALNTGPSRGGLPGRPVVEQNRKVVSLRKSDVPSLPHPRPPTRPLACRGGGCGFQPPTIPARARPRRSPATRTPARASRAPCVWSPATPAPTQPPAPEPSHARSRGARPAPSRRAPLHPRAFPGWASAARPPPPLPLPPLQPGRGGASSVSSDMAAEEAEAPGLPEDEVRGGCGPLGGPPSRRGRPVIRARARPRALERDTRGGRSGEGRARGGCGEQVPADQGHRPPWRPPGALATAWARAASRGGRWLGWGDIPGPASRSCRSGSRQNLATFLPWLPRGPGGNAGRWDSFDSAASVRCGEFTLCFKAFVRVFSKNEGKRSRNT